MLEVTPACRWERKEVCCELVETMAGLEDCFVEARMIHHILHLSKTRYILYGI